MDSDKSYIIKYKMEIGLFSKQEVDTEEYCGLCDAIIIHSLIFHEDGVRSEVLVSYDGKTKQELSDDELFKSWVIMSLNLSNSKTLGENRKELCRSVYEVVKAAIISTKTEG